MEKQKSSVRYAPEVRERAVRMVLEHGGSHASQWEAIASIAAKIGCSGETLRKWVRQAERDHGLRAGPTSAEQARIKALERENRDHSDRGSQYVSIRYTERLAEAGIEPSVGSLGDSYDNALAETVIGLFKTEVIRRRGPWRHAAGQARGLKAHEAVEFATLEWVDWFNHRRLLEPIGNIPPAEAEARYHAQIAGPAIAA